MIPNMLYKLIICLYIFIFSDVMFRQIIQHYLHVASRTVKIDITLYEDIYRREYGGYSHPYIIAYLLSNTKQCSIFLLFDTVLKTAPKVLRMHYRQFLYGGPRLQRNVLGQSVTVGKNGRHTKHNKEYCIKTLCLLINR